MSKTATITALDIGTSSIKLLIGQKTLGTEGVGLLGQTQVPCFGVRKGEVFNPQEVSRAILEAKDHLQILAHRKIKKVIVNLGGSHLFALPSQGLISVSRADRKISEEDIQRVIQACKAVNLPSNKEILDIFPKEFLVDGEGKIEEPLGLEGIRLEVRALLICGFSPVLENLEKAVFEADLEIEDIVPSILASARACLTPQQKELGVGLIDIGAENTGVCFFEEGKLLDLAVFSLGSAHITNDIAIGLRTEISTAERIKREFATLLPKSKKKRKEKIEIPEKSLSFSPKFLREIIEARVSEIFSEAEKALKKIRKETILPAGIVLTGGGSLSPGIVEFAKQKFELPCYLAIPKCLPGLKDPSFSTVAGLLLSGFDLLEEERKGLEGKFKEKIKRIFKIFLP
ncbi:MAG: cell division protein FtsA [Patescibacteria group bacterium]|nr:cell division protein FtsA [Patescibacteria group bacterium]